MIFEVFDDSTMEKGNEGKRRDQQCEAWKGLYICGHLSWANIAQDITEAAMSLFCKEN